MIPFIQQIDDTIMIFIANNLHTPFLDRLMVFFTALGDSSRLWIGLIIFLILFKKDRKWGILIAVALIFESLLCDNFLKPLVARERPFTRLSAFPAGTPLIVLPRSYSFPSGHTMSSFVAATILYCRQKSSGIFFYIIAALIGFSRIYLFVHYPSDVFAGIILGIILALVMVKALNIHNRARVKG